MKEYLLLFRGGVDPSTKSPEEFQADMAKWTKWMGDLAQQGKLTGAQPLARTGKQVTGTKKLVTDGPFMEGKEMVGGYLMCKAATYDEAVAISKDCPILEFENGSVEIRELQQM
jgi:hypothetical protein